MRTRLYSVAAAASLALLAVSPSNAEESGIRKTTLSAAGTTVKLLGKVVTLSCPDFFYVQEPDRSAGIRVDKPGHSAKRGDVVDLAGELRTFGSGERYIAADTVTVTGEGSVWRPLAFNNISLGGWSWRWIEGPDGELVEVWQPCFGLSPRGLLVRTWGHVTQVDPSESCFFVDDGSHLSDYAKTRIGVKAMAVDALFDIDGLTIGAYVAVTGACGGYPDETTGDFQPIILVLYASDVQILSPQ